MACGKLPLMCRHLQQSRPHRSCLSATSHGLFGQRPQGIYMSIDPNRFGVVGAVTPLVVLLGLCTGGRLGFGFPEFPQQFLNFRPDPQGHCLFFAARCTPLPFAVAFPGTSAAFSAAGSVAAGDGTAAAAPSAAEGSTLLSGCAFSTLSATASSGPSFCSGHVEL